MKLFDRPTKKVQTDVVQNGYYESVSEKFGIAQVILYLSLLAFVVLFFLSNTNLLTYRNFYYFIKDLNASAESVDVVNTDSVSYPTDEFQSFTLYRRGLAVAGNGAVTVFNATGRQTISEHIAYTSPVSVGRGKYLLVYDLGGTKYSLYNSYTQIFEGECERPISGAAVSDTGMYALISSSSSYQSVVSLYSSNFSLLNVYNKNGYVSDVCISPNGKNVAMVTSSVVDGRFSTELMVCQVQATTAKASVKIAESLAISCVFSGNDLVNVLCSDGAYVYRTNGEAVNAYRFMGDTVVASDVTENGIAVCLGTLGGTERKQTLVLNERGETVYHGDAPAQIDALVRSENVVYLQTSSGILRLDLTNGTYTEKRCHTEQRTLLAVSDTEALLCSPQKAVYYHFD